LRIGAVARRDAWCRVSAQERVGEGLYHLHLKAPEIASSSRPGQFLMVSVTQENSKDPFLRRPFSISGIGKDGQVSILYKVVGKGTRILSRVSPGMRLRVLGPLGKGFLEEAEGERILVGGGLGIAPLLFLMEGLKSKKKPFHLFYGVSSRKDIPRIEGFLDSGKDYLTITSEDGSIGQKGLVTQGVALFLQELDGKKAFIQACGPLPMLKALYGLALRFGAGIEVSLEAHMACGIGICLGCAFKGRSGLLHVCKDGPVFKGEEVFGLG